MEFLIESGLPADHPKLQRFQEKLGQIFRNRICGQEEKINSLRKELELKQRLKLEKKTFLHELQKNLQHESQHLDKLGQDEESIAEKNLKLKKQNQKMALTIDGKTNLLNKLLKERNQLRIKFNKILEIQIEAEARRVKMAGDLTAENMAMTKTEEQFNDLQKTKKLQDLYVEKLQFELEQMEQKAIEYQEQTDQINEQTVELKKTVRRAEEEAEKIRKEKLNLFQKWNNSVLNIAKRDQAISSFNEAVNERRIELKKVKSEVQETQQEVVRLQEEHDHFTSIEKRNEKICQSKENQIKHSKSMISDASHDLTKATKAKLATIKTLQATNEEFRSVSEEANKARNEMEKLDKVKRNLEGDVFTLCHENLTTEKSSKFTRKIINSIRSSAEDIDAKIVMTKNNLTLILQELESRSSIIRDHTAVQRNLEGENSKTSLQLDKVEDLILKTQALVDKRQSGIDTKEKLRSQLAEDNRGSHLHPIEKDLRRLKEEIAATETYCNEAKAQWLKLQQGMIQKTRMKSELSDEVNQGTRKYLIMNEKKMKLDKEIEAMHSNVEIMRRKIENKDSHNKRLDSHFHEEQRKHQGAIKDLETQRSLDTDMLNDMAKEIDAAREEIECLEDQLELKKEEAFEADADVHEWEQKVHSCKDTLSTVNKKRGREGEMEHLRGEAHKLQVKLEQIERQTKSLMDTIENSVGRRDNLVDKATTINLIHQERKPQYLKSLADRKQEEFKLKLKRLNREENFVQEKLKNLQEKEQIVQAELQKRKAFLQKIRESISKMEEQSQELMKEKYSNLALTVQHQTRAKWYKAIKDKRYRLTIRDEDSGQVELSELTKQNEELRKTIDGMKEEFPYLADNLSKLECTLNM